MNDAQKRTKDAVEQKIEELQAGQYRRAGKIETALRKYEKNIRIRSVQDYVSLVKTQRTIIGLDSGDELPLKGSFKVEVSFVSPEKKG